MNDPFNLQRFVDAQEAIYDIVLAELMDGHKRSHWMWFIFPQIAGLGSSPTAVRYAISTLAEARAYLAHPLLGPRLLRCTQTLNAHTGRTAREIFGSPDDMKLRSSMTLFREVAEDSRPFQTVIDDYFAGQPDDKTLAALASFSIK
ncbi:DUF1810 domain-containing protein [Pararhizobium gei]|uniref:DUF1810 domain-containing protein n=1 Tax=Pararhizobium gei TaxID=1395951 RepID=UPI0023DC3A8F|nr:DUF1810 domain-containing protein [Rhizobium gei]